MKPNQQINWKTPLQYLKELETTTKDGFQHSPSAIISERTLYQMTKDLGGQRYLSKPPQNWPPGAQVSIDL